MELKIIFSGIGGQGIVVASDIYCEAALLDGFDVAKAEVHGMAPCLGLLCFYDEYPAASRLLLACYHLLSMILDGQSRKWKGA